MRDAAGRFLPGAVGNPNGRPKGPDVLGEIYRQLMLVMKPGEDERTVLEAVIQQLILKALQGSSDHMRLLMDRIAPLKLILDHAGGGPVFAVRFIDYSGEKPREWEQPIDAEASYPKPDQQG